MALCKGREEPEESGEHSHGDAAGGEGEVGIGRANIYTIGNLMPRNELR